MEEGVCLTLDQIQTERMTPESKETKSSATTKINHLQYESTDPGSGPRAPEARPAAAADRGSVSGRNMKSSFPSGCRLTASLVPSSSSSPPLLLLLPSSSCYVEARLVALCNILIGRRAGCGRVRGRGQTYCDPTISCFVRSTF